MTTIQYLNEQIHVPEKWEDVKLRDYENFFLEKPETLADKVAYVAKICNTDPELILKWPSEVFGIIVDKTFFLFEREDANPLPSIDIEGIKYVIPIEEKLTLGAYIDADQIQREGVNPLSNILAIVCRPEGETYNHELNDQRAEMFGALSMDKVRPLLAFFLHCKHVLDRHTSAYTNLRQAVESLPPSIGVFRKHGGGIKLSQTWQILKYGALIMLLRYRLRRYLRLSSTSAIKITQNRRRGR